MGFLIILVKGVGFGSYEGGEIGKVCGWVLSVMTSVWWGRKGGY